MMDPGRQALRFGIPGAVLLGWTIGSYIVVRWLSGEDLSVIAGPVQRVDAVLAIVGSIPLGWLVYQLYFLLYRPWILNGRFIRRDRGADVLAHLSPAQYHELKRVFEPGDLRTPVYDQTDNRGWFPVLRLAPVDGEPRPWWKRASRQERITYAHHWRVHWELVQTLLIFVEARGGEAIAAEHRRLSDVYHGTGCARYALYGGATLGSAAALLQLERRGTLLGESVVGAVGILLLTGLLCTFALHHVRREAWKRSVAVLGRGLRVHLAAEPRILNDLSGELRRAPAPDDTTRLRDAPVLDG